MGDIIALEHDIGGAVSSAVESGFYTTALHNHFILEEPSVLFTHVEGTADDGAMVMGDLVVLETEINPVMMQLLEGGVDAAVEGWAPSNRHAAVEPVRFPHALSSIYSNSDRAAARNTPSRGGL